MDRNCFQCSEPVPLTDGHFRDITFNGVQFLLLDAVNSEIYKYDCNFCFIETVALSGKYTSICYDWEEQCYFALANHSAANLFRLDESFHEIGQTRMRNAPQWNANDICYDGSNRTVWVSFPNRIAYTDKSCGEYTFVKNDCEGQTIRNLLVLPQCRLLATCAGKRESIHIIQPDCGERMKMNIPEGFRMEGMCVKEPKDWGSCKKHCIYILLTQICSQSCFVMCCTINCCHGCDPDDDNCCCEKELCQVIHSIALAEVGIAHILNAEGEKIQKAVAASKTTRELLEVNDSVRDNIIRITQLENQLTLKLEAAMRSFCKKNPCKK